MLMHSILILICLAFLSISCERKGYNSPEKIDHIILAYLGGDNDLSDEVHQKIEAFKRGWTSGKNNKLYIYQDTSGDTPRLLEVCLSKRGEPITQLLQVFEEENSASPEVFSRVVLQIKQLYPDASYSLIIFSHTTGWLPEGQFVSPTRSIIMDGNHEMELTDFANAIPNNIFHSIIFEACFMAGIEVAWELKDKTDYIFASSAEIVSPGFTEVYPYALNYLVDKKLQNFGESVFDYYNTQTGWKRSATFSLIKSSELNPLAIFIKNSVNWDIPPQLSEIQSFDRNRYHLFYDFEGYYSSLLSDDIQRERLSDLIGNCVIWKAATTEFLSGYGGFPIKKHSGLTTYIPMNNFPGLNKEYTKLGWCREVSIPIR